MAIANGPAPPGAYSNDLGFAGYQQHDSQELLAYVLSGINEDLRFKEAMQLGGGGHSGEAPHEAAARRYLNPA